MNDMVLIIEHQFSPSFVLAAELAMRQMFKTRAPAQT